MLQHAPEASGASSANNLSITKFTFDAHLAEWEGEAFVDAFFAHPHVTGHLRLLRPSGSWGPMPCVRSTASAAAAAECAHPGPGESEHASSLSLDRVQRLPMAHSVTSLAFFDRIAAHGMGLVWPGPSWAARWD